MASLSERRTPAFRALAHRYAAPGAAAALFVVIVAYVLPERARAPLAETAAWGAVVLASFCGWGSLVARAVFPRAPVDLGLRAAWGAALACALGGALFALSLMTRAAALLIVDAGALLALAFLALERGAFARRARFVLRVARREWLLALLALAVLGLLALHYFGAVADWHTNPYDDDIAYLAFVKKMIDTGTLIEPFSFRRLSALGGQLFFLELVAPRADFAQSHTFDRGIALVMLVMLLFGYRQGARRAPLLAVLGATTFLLFLPTIAINTGAYYSGACFFFALYRTLLHLHAHPPSTPLRAALPLALLSAAACTLRQNFLPVPAVALGVSYAFVVARSTLPWRERVREPLFAAGLTLLFVAPWMYVSWRSNGTVLYPAMLGDGNPAVKLESTQMTWLRELQIQVRGFIEIVPIRTMPLFFVAGLLQREASPRKPLLALMAATFVSTALINHAFTQSDPGNVARYIASFVIALALAVSLGAATAREALRAPFGRATAATGLVFFVLAVEIVLAQDGLRSTCTRLFRNIDLAHAVARRTETAEAPLYKRLQAQVPAGARLAVLLDEPFYLDFGRNPIWNLDMPGYASPAPGEPFFEGAEAHAAYFQKLGARYIAFVRPERARYHYRREYWVERLVDEEELWRTHAPYVIDFMDALTELAQKKTVLFEERGLVLIDLGGDHAP